MKKLIKKIDDFILLGRAVPVRLKDGRATICAAGISEELKSLIRIYPTKINMGIRRWDICSLKIEKNSIDTRTESWKIAGSQSEWDNLSDKIEKIGRINSKEERVNLINKYITPCPKILNLNRKSLGLIRPNIIETYFESNKAKKKSNTLPTALTEFTDPDKGDIYYQRWVKTIEKYDVEPRIKWLCSENCEVQKEHNMKVLEWGAYEWIRKNPSKMNQIWGNLRIYDNKYDKVFLVGNQQNYRTSFLIISILRWKKKEKKKSIESFFNNNSG